jgi:ATP-dependent DNA ligase
MFEAVCRLGLEGIVSKKLNAPYRSGPSRTWIKVKNPKHRQQRALLMGLSEVCRVRTARLGHSIYQFAEAAAKLSIKDVFDGVRTFTHYGMKLV